MPRLPLKKLIVFHSSLFKAFDDCSRGRCTRSTGPIEVFRASDGYQLLDGHHRLVEYLLNQKHLENSHTIPVKVRTGPSTLDYAVADFDKKIPKYSAYMQHNGWGKMPPIHGVFQIVDEQDIEDYQEAEEGGYEHELDWSRPLTPNDLGTAYVNIEDGHNRAYAAREAGIPIRVKIF